MIVMVEDNNDELSSLLLNNSISGRNRFEELKEMFPMGTKIGIKQPYMKLPFNGNIMLRNDNM